MVAWKICSICSAELRDQDHENLHIPIHTPSKWRPHCCTSCPSFFTRLSDLRRHESKYHKRPMGRTFAECKYCKLRMREVRLAKHLLTHTRRVFSPSSESHESSVHENGVAHVLGPSTSASPMDMGEQQQDKESLQPVSSPTPTVRLPSPVIGPEPQLTEMSESSEMRGQLMAADDKDDDSDDDVEIERYEEDNEIREQEEDNEMEGQDEPMQQEPDPGLVLVPSPTHSSASSSTIDIYVGLDEQDEELISFWNLEHEEPPHEDVISALNIDDQQPIPIINDDDSTRHSTRKVLRVVLQRVALPTVSIRFRDLVAGCTGENAIVRENWAGFLESSPLVRDMFPDLMSFLHSGLILHEGDLEMTKRALAMLRALLTNPHVHVELGAKAEELCFLHIGLVNSRSICYCSKLRPIGRVEFERHMSVRNLAAHLIGRLVELCSGNASLLRVKCKLDYARTMYGVDSSTEVVIASMSGLLSLGASSAITNGIHMIGERLSSTLGKTTKAECKPYIDHMIGTLIGNLFHPDSDNADDEESFCEKYGFVGPILYAYLTTDRT